MLVFCKSSSCHFQHAAVFCITRGRGNICHGIAISLPVDLSAPVVLLRPLALVMLSHDAVKAHGTGDIACKQLSPGP